MTETAELADLRVLIVDDEADIRLGLVRLLGSLGIEAQQAADGQEALTAVEGGTWDLVLTDLRMPGMTGAELLVEIKRRFPAIAVVLLSGFGTVQVAVQCLQDGASHFLQKPFDNQDVLDIVRRLGRQLLARRRPDGEQAILVAEDPAMLRTLDLVRQVAPSRVPVLLEGESGSGKEVVARALHRWSSVAEKGLVAVNCAALSDTLLESELFGHVRGAFTGADSDHRGVFEMAAGGSVFLDEVASMSPSFQAKLLRVLQEKVVRPVGSDHDVEVDFRLIAATNRGLREMVEAGDFREDLFFRMRVMPVEIPPLRSRPKDILPLALHFLKREIAICMGEDHPEPGFAIDAIAEMESHSWPGNVRELENAVTRASIVSGGETIRAHHLGLFEDPGIGAMSGRERVDYAEAKRLTVERFQRDFVVRALRRSGGNVSQAASDCGLTRAAFQKILRQLDIDRSRYV